MTALHATGEAPTGALATEGLVESPALRLLADPDAERVLVLVAEPGIPVFDEHPGPTGTTATAEAPDESAPPGPVYVSDKGRVTTDAEVPAHEIMAARLRGTPTFGVEVSIPGATSRGLRANVGAIEISNADRALNAWLGYRWEGARVTLRVGGTYDVGRATETTLLFQEYPILWRGTVDSVQADHRALTLRLRSPLARLERPLRRNVYAGTGSSEGGADLEGVRKTLRFGRLFNVSPTLVDAATLLYQVHDGSVEAIPAVRDRGVALTAAGDQGDLAALQAWTSVAGQYATSLETGFFRLGAPPSGQVTADVDGDNTSGFVAEPRGIARRILRRYGPLADSEIDLSSFLAFPPRGVSGYELGDADVSVLRALEEILHPVDGWVSIDGEGRLAIGAFESPDSAPISASYTDAQMLSVRQEVGTQGAPLPVWEVRINFRRHEVVQDPDALASGLTAAERDDLAKRALFVTRRSQLIRDAHPMALSLELDTRLERRNDSASLASAVLARHSRRRQVYRITVTRSAPTGAATARSALRLHRPGDVIEVTTTRAALSAKRLLVVGVVEQATGRVELIAWG